jgi:pimeloyl-ACP methyl ester carboxylesterase
LIQGLDDTTVTPDQVDAIAAHAPQATVWKVPGAAHVECLKTDPSGYEAHVAAFLASLP